MPIELRRELFEWLAKNGAIGSKKGRRKDKTVECDSDSQTLIESGVAVSRVINACIGRQAKLDTIKQTGGATSATKLYNWNLLLPVLKQLEVTINQDQKALIIAGDTDILIDLLERLFKSLRNKMRGVSNTNNGKRGKGMGSMGMRGKATNAMNASANMNEFQGQPDIPLVRSVSPSKLAGITEDSNMLATDASSVTELIVITMVQQLGIRPQQAAALLTTNSRYLVHIMMHGVKGSFEPVVAWLSELHTQCKFLRGMLSEEAQTNNALLGVLNTLRPALISQSNEVVILVCRILQSLGNDFSNNGQSEVAWTWFVASPNGSGLSGVVSCMRRHTDVKRCLAPVVELFSRRHLTQLFTTHIHALLPRATDYMAFVNELLDPLANCTNTSSDALIKTGVVEHCMQVGLKNAEPQLAEGLRNTALSLLVDMWVLFPEVVEQNQEIPKQILALLKKGVRDANLSLQVTSLTGLFTLLDAFALDHNSFAPYVYKTLIFSLIENHANEIVRDYIIANMMASLSKMQHVPVGVMVEPLVKQATLNGYTNMDFDFFIVVSKHQRLGLRHALLLLDLLGKVSLNDPLFGRVATVPLLILVNRFCNQQPMLEYLERFAKVALSMFMHVETRAQRQQQKAKAQGKRNGDASTDAAHVRRTLILEALAKIIHLGHAEVNSRFRPLLMTVDKQFASMKGSDQGHAGLAALQAFCERTVAGDSDIQKMGMTNAAAGADVDVSASLGPDFDMSLTQNIGNAGNASGMGAGSGAADQDTYVPPGQSPREKTIAKREAQMREREKELARREKMLRDREDGGKKLVSSTDDISTAKKQGGRVSFKNNRRSNNRGGGRTRADLQASSNATSMSNSPRVRGRRFKNAKVQDDIDKARKRLVDVQLRKQKENDRKRLKSARIRKRLRKNFEKKMEFKYRKQAEDAQRGHPQKLFSTGRKRLAKGTAKHRAGLSAGGAAGIYGVSQDTDRRAAIDTTVIATGDDKGTLSIDPHTGEKTWQRNTRRDGVFNQGDIEAMQEEYEDGKLLEAEAAQMLKQWLKPLKHVFKWFSRTNLDDKPKDASFNDMTRNRDTMSSHQWLALMRDFEMLSTNLTAAFVTAEEAKLVFQHANISFGRGQDLEIGARANHTRSLTLPEFLSAILQVGLTPSFACFPTRQGKVEAIITHMRNIAINVSQQPGTEKQQRGGTSKRHRMGTNKVWECKPVPMFDYRYKVPAVLGLPTSVCAALEALDYIVSGAVGTHILECIKVPRMPSADPLDVDPYGATWKPKDSTYRKTEAMERLYQIEAIQKKAPKHPPKRIKGFLGNYVPVPEEDPSKKSRRKRNTKRRFGDQAVGQVPLKWVPVAKVVAEIVGAIADEVVSGASRQRLEKIYRFNTNPTDGQISINQWIPNNSSKGGKPKVGVNIVALPDALQPENSVALRTNPPRKNERRAVAVKNRGKTSMIYESKQVERVADRKEREKAKKEKDELNRERKRRERHIELQKKIRKGQAKKSEIDKDAAEMRKKKIAEDVKAKEDRAKKTEMYHNKNRYEVQRWKAKKEKDKAAAQKTAEAAAKEQRKLLKTKMEEIHKKYEGADRYEANRQAREKASADAKKRMDMRNKKLKERREVLAREHEKKRAEKFWKEQQDHKMAKKMKGKMLKSMGKDEAASTIQAKVRERQATKKGVITQKTKDTFCMKIDNWPKVGGRKPTEGQRNAAKNAVQGATTKAEVNAIFGAFKAGRTPQQITAAAAAALPDDLVAAGESEFGMIGEGGKVGRENAHNQEDSTGFSKHIAEEATHTQSQAFVDSQNNE